MARVGDLLIYGLADPRTGAIHYIGKSKTALRRPRRHGAELLLKDPTPKGHWVRALAADGVRYDIKVLEEVEKVVDLDAHERFWIAQGRGLSWPLVNVTRGGKGTDGMRHGPQSRARIGIAQAGRIHTDEHRAKNAAGLRAHWSGGRSSEYHAKLSAALKGYTPLAAHMKRTPEWRANASAAQKARREKEWAEFLAREGRPPAPLPVRGREAWRLHRNELQNRRAARLRASKEA